MSTVRFTQVVKKSGKPEVYLLLSKDDKTFQDALRHDRILSLVGGVDGAKTEYGVVGYDAKRRGQLLLFPRSLKSFADSRVVGIKFDLFSEPTGHDLPVRDRSIKPAQRRPAKSHHEKDTPVAPEKPRTEDKHKSKKVIPFPRAKAAPPAKKKLNLEQMEDKARQALRALEKNNPVAAYKLLRQMVPE